MNTAFNKIRRPQLSSIARFSALLPALMLVAIQQNSSGLVPMANPGGPYTAFEGQFVTLDGSASSDPQGGTLTFEWIVNGQVFNGAIVNVFFPDNFEGEALLTVVDNDGNSASASAQISVANVNPTVEAFIDRSLDIGGVLSLENVSFFDPGRADTHTATIDWGDDTPITPGMVVEANGLGEVFASHLWRQNGIFVTEICVIDDDGGVGCDSFTVTVIGEPTPTPTDSPTPTPTPLPTFTPMPTPDPCSPIKLIDPRFRRDNFRVAIVNTSTSASFTLTRVVLQWPDEAETLDWMRLNRTIIWNGNDSNPPTDTDLEPSWRNRSITTFEPGADRRFDVDFDHPGDLKRFAHVEDFFGTTFFFEEGCSVTLGADIPTATASPTVTPSPTPLPYSPPDFPQCPATFDLLATFEDQLRRDKEPRSHTSSFTLGSDSSVWISGWVKEGHPERGCPAHPTCSQNQDHEDVIIEINSLQIGSYEDSEHGPDENAWFATGPFSTDLEPGVHSLVFRHSLHGSGPQSVDYRISLCARPR